MTTLPTIKNDIASYENRVQYYDRLLFSLSESLKATTEPFDKAEILNKINTATLERKAALIELQTLKLKQNEKTI